MAINVYLANTSTLIASGTLTIDNSTNPPTGTFQPTGGTSVPCLSLSWSDADLGVTDFSFAVSGQANGDFQCGEGGSEFIYVFNGTENATATEANGTVEFPSTASIRGDGGDPPVWQGDATTEVDPIKRGVAAK